MGFNLLHLFVEHRLGVPGVLKRLLNAVVDEDTDLSPIQGHSAEVDTSPSINSILDVGNFMCLNSDVFACHFWSRSLSPAEVAQ